MPPTGEKPATEEAARAATTSPHHARAPPGRRRARARYGERPSVPWGRGFSSRGSAPPVLLALSAALNYISQELPRPSSSGDGSGSGDWIGPGHTQAGLVTMEEIGILVEKAQVRGAWLAGTGRD